MKRIHTAALILLAGTMLINFSACRFNCVHGSGNSKSETRKVEDFDKISISGGYKVTLVQDSSRTVKITADDNLLKYIKVEVDGSRLKIYSRRSFCNTGELTLNIGIRNLEELKASGGVEIIGDGKINTKDLRLKLSGATKVTMDLNAAHLTTSGSGATEINLKGQASSHDVDLSGDGNVSALDFVVGDYNIQTSGMGNCQINVLHTLSVHSSGASEVKYRGNPSSVSNDKSGASSVEKIN